MSPARAPDTTSCFHLLLPPPPSTERLEAPRSSAGPSRSLPRAHPPPLFSLSHAPESDRRRRSLPSCPEPPPQPSAMPKGSASTPSSSPSTHSMPDAPERSPRRRIQPREADFTMATPSSLSLPRARFDAPCTLRELLPPTPLLCASFSCRSRCSTRDRCAPPPGFSPPWPQPPQLEPELTIVLSTIFRSCRHPQRLLPCPVAPPRECPSCCCRQTSSPSTFTATPVWGSTIGCVDCKLKFLRVEHPGICYGRWITVCYH